MYDIHQLLKNNREWAARMSEADFLRCAQEPPPIAEYLWIGCSECEFPPSAVVGLLPGQVYLYSSLANQMLPTDISSVAVLQYAVEVLRVKHIIVCGHDNCGIIQATLAQEPHGLVDGWLNNLRTDLQAHQEARQDHGMPAEMPLNQLCKWNVIRQVENVVQSACVQDAWRRKQPLQVHGWIFYASDRYIKDLDVSYGGIDSLRR